MNCDFLIFYFVFCVLYTGGVWMFCLFVTMAVIKRDVTSVLHGCFGFKLE